MCINNCIDNNFSETAMPVYTKFHVEISVEGGFSAYFSGLAQDDCHAHIWYKILKSLLENQESFKFIIICTKTCCGYSLESSVSTHKICLIKN